MGVDVGVGKKLYLHIGLHKTGSTSVQAHLVRNASILEERGLLYPKSGRVGSGHANLYWQLADSRQYRPEVGGWDEVLDEIAESTAAKVVVSAEGLGLLDDEGVGRVADIVDGFDPTIVVYLRRQDQLVQSVFAQRVKDGMTTDFASFAQKESRERLYHFYDVVASWSAAFGRRALRIRVFEPEQLVGGDLTTDFFDALDANDIQGALGEPARLNESATPEGLAVIQRVAQLRKARGEFDRPQFTSTIGKTIAAASRAIEWDGRGRSLMGGTEAHRFLDEFAVQNAKVARELLGREDGTLFRRQPDVTAEGATANVDDLSPAALVDLLDRVAGSIAPPRRHTSNPAHGRRQEDR